MNVDTFDIGSQAKSHPIFAHALVSLYKDCLSLLIQC